MKKYLLTFIILPFIFLAQLSANSLKEAEHLFQSQNYEKALSIYHETLLNHPNNAQLLYNLGTTYAKNQQYGYARFYFKKAQKIIPRDTSLKENLRFVEKKIIDQEYLKQSLFRVVMNSFNTLISLQEAWILFIILLTCFNIILWLKNNIKFAKTKRIYTPIFILLCISSFLLLSKLYQLKFNQQAMIVQPKASIHAGPSNQLPTLFFIHAGTEFSVLDIKNNWSKIKLSSGRKGWIQQSDYKQI